MSRPPLRRFLRLLLLLLCAACVWLVWYGAKRGVTRSWRERIFAEFRAQGIEITFKKLTVDPFHGLVARDVAIFDADDHLRVLAEVDRLSLNIDWSRLIKRRPFVSALELRNARLSLPLDRSNPRSQRIEVARLQARLLLPEKQIRLVHAEAKMLGLNLRAQGWISNPASPQPDGGNARLEWLPYAERAVQELQAIQWHGDAPVLKIQFSGDMSAPDSFAAAVQLESDEFKIQDKTFESIALAAAWKDGALAIDDLVLEDKQGSLRMVGRWSPGGRLEARVESTLNPCELSLLAGDERLSQVLEFQKRPKLRVQVDGELEKGAPLRVTGSAETTRFQFKKELFKELTLTGAWEGERWSLRDVRLVHQSGTLSADVMVSPGEFRAKLKSNLPLPVLHLALPAMEASSPVYWLQSQDPLRLDLEVVGTAPALNACTGWGKVQAGRGSFRNIAFEQFSTPLRVRGGVWSFGPLKLKRTEGEGEGSVTYDVVNNGLYLHELKLRLNPVETMWMIEPEWVPEVTPYRFKGPPPFVTVNGFAKPHSAEHTRIAVSVDSKGGMDYDFAGKTLPVDEIAAQILFTPHRVQLTSVAGKLFGGRIDGNVDISVKPDSAPHNASLYITGMDFAALSQLYTGYDESKGKLNCSFLWKGDDDNAKKVDGSGQLSITDGNVFLIPFLGPLSTLLNGIVPGLGVSKAHKATASFTVKDGVFNTRNLHIDGGGFTLRGHGDLRFVEDTIQFYARVNARSLPGLVLFPVSKLFEYAADGKLSKPIWKLRMLTKREREGGDLGTGDPEGASEGKP